MRFGVVIPTWGAYWADGGRIGSAIRAAEAYGYDTAWFGDHIVIPAYAAHLSSPDWFDALACCIHGTGITERLRFAPDVLVLPYRNPVELAHVVASADQLSGGRITLGVGVGYISGEFDALGAPPYHHRGAVTDEYLRVLRALWEATGPISFDGRWVRFQDVIPGPAPHQRPLPVLVGGNAPAALRRAAEHGNGWHPLFPAPEVYAAGRRVIEEARRAQGKRDHFAYSYSCSPCRIVLDGEDRPATTGYEGAQIPEEYHYAPPLPAADDGRVMFVGNPSEVIGDFRSLESAGVEQVALRLWAGAPDPGMEDWTQQLERFAQLVLPSFPNDAHESR